MLLDNFESVGLQSVTQWGLERQTSSWTKFPSIPTDWYLYFSTGINLGLVSVVVSDKKKAHSLRLHKENDTREKEKMTQARKMDTGSSQSSHSHGSGSSRSSRSSGSSRISRTSGKSSRISNNSRCLLWWMRIKLAQSLRVDVLSSFLGADATTDTKLPISEMYQLNLSRRCFSARFRISRDELPPSKQTTNQN